MNYETTITADAADGVATDFAGARTVPSFAMPRWLLVGGAGLFVVLLLIGAYFAFAGGSRRRRIRTIPRPPR